MKEDNGVVKENQNEEVAAHARLILDIRKNGYSVED